METAITLVLLAITVLTITGASERADLPTPLVLIAAGIGASFLPFVEGVELNQDIVLFGLLPPLLYSAALNTSLIDFNANRRPILLLSVGLVVFTTLGVAWLIHTLIPGIHWPAALAIGAVIAPPDAVAATAIGRRIGLPRRLVNILEGESLLNDATALVALRMAIVAMSATVGVVEVAEDFLLAAGGGVLVGFLGFLIVGWLRKQIISEPLIDNALSFITPFAAYIAAEEVHGSGVIAVVVAGILLAHKAPVLQTASSRVAERHNWRTISFVLEHAVFFIIGLQASWLIEEVNDSELSFGRIVFVCLAALVAIIVLRLVWVFPVRYLLVRPGADRDSGQVPPWTYTFIVGWAGMRGVVTLAAAYLLPLNTEHRGVLLLVAFTAVAGTLFIQGLTLPWLAQRLKVPSPDPMEDALARADLLHQASSAGLECLEKLEEDPHGTQASVIARVEQRNFAAWERLGASAEDETPSEAYVRVRQLMIAAEREKVLEVRNSGAVASDIVRDVLGMLDIEESMLDVSKRAHTKLQAAVAERVPGQTCPELSHAAGIDVPDPLTPGVCPGCQRDGTAWVHLRMCLACAEVGCCDSSVGKHATRHFEETGHPVMTSIEAGESWRWCFVHESVG